MKKLDLGNSDFKIIIENNNYFIDKSLLIKEIIDIQKQVYLLESDRLSNDVFHTLDFRHTKQ